MDQKRLAALLQELQTPHTAQLKAITAELQKNFYSRPESLLQLAEIACSHGDANVRQQAAVQGARLVFQHWPTIPKEQKPQVRQHLVNAIINEQSAKCRHATSRLVADIGALDLKANEWQNLLPSLLQLVTASDGDVSKRDVASYIIFCLLEATPETFGNKQVQMFGVFARTIRDSSAEVRINTMLSIGAMLMMVESEEEEGSLELLHDIIPSMIDVLKDVVQSGDEEKINNAFEVFMNFLAYDSAILGPFLKDLVQLMIDLASNKAAEDDVRSRALSFLTQAAQYRRMKIQGMSKMGEQLTQKSMLIVSEVDDDDDDDQNKPAQGALALLDQLSNDLPPRQVIVPLLDAFPKFATSEDKGLRKAAALSLGTVAEGSPDFVASQLKSFFPQLITLLNDADAGVRHTAVVCVARLADEMADELVPFVEALVTSMVKNLQAAVQPAADVTALKKSTEMIRSVCGAIDSMADGLEADAVQPYAGELVKYIGALFQHGDHKVKMGASGAVAAIAQALGNKFEPFFETTMHVLGNYLTLKDSEEDLALRSGATDSVGRIAAAVGAEIFQPYVMKLMEASEQGLQLDNTRLRESSFILWSSFAKVYEQNFAHFLPGVFKALFMSLEIEDDEIALELSEDDKQIAGGDNFTHRGRKIKLRDSEAAEDDGMDENDEDNWENEVGFTAEAFEKEVAVEVLGDIISYSCGPNEINEYLEKAVETVSPLLRHDYEGCRKAAIGTLWRAYGRVWQVYEKETGTHWTPGLLLAQQPSETLTKLGQIVSKATMALWPEENERSIVTEINRNVAATLKLCGPAILTQQDMLTQTVTLVGTIITRSHPCQLDLGDDEVEAEVQGSSEYDWLVIDTALDVVIGLSQALGSSFGELWKAFEKPIVKFGSSNDDLERSTAVGVIAECTTNMGAAVTPYTAKLLALLLKRLSDTDKETKSNAAYAIGQLVYHSTASGVYMAHLDRILSKLEPMLEAEEARMRDNAIGCACRMMIAHPEKMPIAQMLPHLVDLLPLKNDYEENRPLYHCIGKLYELEHPTVIEQTPKLLTVFQNVLSPPEEQLAPETRSQLKRLVQLLASHRPELFKGHEELAQLAA